MNANEDDAEQFLSLVAGMQAKDARLTPLQAALIVAAERGIARDSRTFARVVGVAHALALREVNALVKMGGSLRVTKREARTLRTHYVLQDGTAGDEAAL
ncbi:hypothetical protein [Aliirhizobium smilacinae]